MRISRRISITAASALLTGAALVGLASPAAAAPGDARALGVQVALNAVVDGDTVINANAVIGNVTAPPGGGNDNEALIPVSLPGATGVTASGLVASVSATRGATSSSSNAAVADLVLNILNVETLDIELADAETECPQLGLQLADTTIVGLEVFGTEVLLPANQPPVTRSSPVTVPNVDNAFLTVSLSRIANGAVLSANAEAVRANVTLSGSVDGNPININVGTVVVGQASCERPGGLAPPTATSISPDSGPQSGNQTVTITGTNFVPGGTTVRFDGVAASDVEVNATGTSLTATTPAGSIGPASVTVATQNGTSAPLTYTYLADGSDAVVNSLTPGSGPTSGGTTVTITGTGFAGATGVTFGGTPGTGFTLNPAGTTITVVTPLHQAGAVPVKLIFPAGAAAAPDFTYTAPTITSIAPNQGPSTGGTIVTITGTGLAAATGVTFDGRPGTNLVADPSGTSLTVVTPGGLLGPVDVTVQVPGGDVTAPDGFTYLAATPVINAVDPSKAPADGGTTVRLTGSGFVAGQTSVSICNQTIPADQVDVGPDGTWLTFRTPACTLKQTTITVSTPGGTSNAVDFRYFGLPVTGAGAAQLLTMGGGMVLTGAGLLLLLLRRRIRGLRG